MNCPKCETEMVDGEAVMHNPASFAWQTIFAGLSNKRLYFRPSSDPLSTMLRDDGEPNARRQGDILILRSDGRSTAFYCPRCKGTFVE